VSECVCVIYYSHYKVPSHTIHTHTHTHTSTGTVIAEVRIADNAAVVRALGGKQVRAIVCREVTRMCKCVYSIYICVLVYCVCNSQY
jgi:hypothetical protein